MTSNNQAPAGVPTLDEIATDPACAASLPREAVLALLAQCSLAQSTLFGHLLASLDNGAHLAGVPPRVSPVPAVARRAAAGRAWLRRSL